MRHGLAQEVFKRPRAHPADLDAAVGPGFQNLGMLAAQAFGQHFGVQGMEASRRFGRIADFQRRLATRAGEEQVNRPLQPVSQRIGEDVGAGDIQRLYAVGGGAAGIGDKHHMRDAAVAGEILAALDVHRLAAALGGFRQQPLLPAIVDAVPGEIDNQLFECAEIGQIFDGFDDVVRLYGPFFIAENLQPLPVDALRPRPILHALQARGHRLQFRQVACLFDAD